ncbi:unnamed protein product, partial [Prorocentrum cordatum]
MENVSFTALLSLSRRDLQALCEERGLPSKGQKPDLLERLLAHEEGSEAPVRPQQCQQPQPQPQQRPRPEPQQPQPPQRGKHKPQQRQAPQQPQLPPRAQSPQQERRRRPRADPRQQQNQQTPQHRPGARARGGGGPPADEADTALSPRARSRSRG